MTTTDHPNVELVRRGFAAMASGDLDTAIATFAPTLRHYGGDAGGHFREFESRDEFFAMVLESMSANEEYSNEVIDVFAAGDELVVVHVVGRRKAPGADPHDMDFVMVLRLEAGVVTRSVDMFGATSERYVSRLGGS